MIVGTHARGALARAILGSVAERVLRMATAPVLVIPPGSDAAAQPAIGTTTT
ncbi:MAG: universal stress protein [Myxococcota bacterium]|nr:universal stress protein [Myxococcota bacterium]